MYIHTVIVIIQKNQNKVYNIFLKKYSLKINSNQHEELKELRKKLGKYFPNIEGFLLPHPGKAVVTKKAFDGKVKGKKWQYVVFHIYDAIKFETMI